MAESTREQKLKILENLPADLQAAFTSDNTVVILVNLKNKYSVSDEKTGDLSRIVGNVILGLLPLTSLSQELNAKIIPEMQIALHLAQDLNVELFFPVMESLKQSSAIANAILAGQQVPKVTSTIPAPVTVASQAAPAPARVVPTTPKPSVDQYRETAETITGSLKPKIGPEAAAPAPRLVVPSVVALRPLETMAPKPVSIPAPMSAPQPIKVPLPTPKPQPAPIRVPVAPISIPVPPTPKPLTFTRPIMPPTPPMPTPKIISNSNLDAYREPFEISPLPVPPQLPTEEMAHPAPAAGKQFIASPAESPATLEEEGSDIIDLRQDKGRF